jgi:hypothetical protein
MFNIVTGVLGYALVAPLFGDTSVARWCVEALYDGVATIVRDDARLVCAAVRWVRAAAQRW